MNSSDPPEDLSFGHLLGQVARLVGARMRARMEGIGLHRAQALMLFQLWQEDGVGQHVLAQLLHVTPATATNTLKRMERDGWVVRRRDTADQRVVQVRLTDKARALHEEVRASLHELDEEMTASLSREERAVLKTSLLKVRRYLTLARQCGGAAPEGGE